MSRRSIAALLYMLPLVLAATVLIPFAGKAFTIDDTLFLLQAQNAVHDPLHPTAFDVVWSDDVWVRCSAIMPSGPVGAYLLVPTILAGGSETVAHSIQLAMLLLGLAGTIVLARRLGLDYLSASVAALLVAASPCVLGMAATAMPDIPAMTFSVWAIERLTVFRDSRRLRDAIAASVLLALAALARPQAGLMLGVALLWVARDSGQGRFVTRIRWQMKDVLPLLLAAVWIGTIAFLGRDPHASNGNLASATVNLSGTKFAHWQRHLVALTVHWGVATPLALVAVLLAFEKLNWLVAGVTTVAIAVVVAGIGFEEAIWVAPFAGVAVAVLLRIVKADEGETVAARMGRIAWLLLPLPIISYVHLPSKYLLPAIPIAAIGVARLFAETRAAQPRRAIAAVALASAVGFFYGSLVLRADATFANFGRKAARELVGPRVNAGETVWFYGHWGFQWYALREGAIPLTKTSAPKPGDILVGPTDNYDGGVLAKHFPEKRYVEQMRKLANGHTMNRRLKAGFYSDWWGILPWVSGWEEIETFTVWRTVPLSLDP